MTDDNTIENTPRKPRVKKTKETKEPKSAKEPKQSKKSDKPKTVEDAAEKPKRRARPGKKAARDSKQLSKISDTLTFCKRGPLMRFLRPFLNAQKAKVCKQTWPVLCTRVDAFLASQIGRAVVFVDHRKSATVDDRDFKAADRIESQN